MQHPRPRNLIVILLDSLNRHLLGAYGSTEFDTPNLDRFAKGATRFDRHFVGALPCMPARHDILCGALDFLWKPWGSIELWEDPVTVPLREAGVVTQLISDHPHLFETGGENYHCDFSAWDYQRGHEGDLWKTRPDPSWVGTPSHHRGWSPYDNSRGWFRGEEDFPGPRTMAAAARWIGENAGHHERFLLFIDEFDPHEPFDTPEPYASMYDQSWEGPHLIWPPYTTQARGGGVLSEREAHQVRACYGGKLTMIDHWLGKLLDAVGAHGLESDTGIIVCTDHGHYLGEKDAFGKPPIPIYQPLGHTPLLIRWPGVEAGAVDALTTNVDLHATLLDVFDVTTRQKTHGRSLLPLLLRESGSIREWALAGYFGREVHVVDGHRKYARAPVEGNAPLSMWSNRWSTMPVHAYPTVKLPPPDQRASLDYMPGSKVPVIRQPFETNDPRPFWAAGRFTRTHLYNVDEDPGEEHNLEGEAIEKDAADLLRAALEEVEAPDEQLVRLGLG